MINHLSFIDISLYVALQYERNVTQVSQTLSFNDADLSFVDLTYPKRAANFQSSKQTNRSTKMKTSYEYAQELLAAYDGDRDAAFNAFTDSDFCQRLSRLYVARVARYIFTAEKP